MATYTTYSVNKNVNEPVYSIIIPDFVEFAPPPGYMYKFMKIYDDIEMALPTPMRNGGYYTNYVWNAEPIDMIISESTKLTVGPVVYTLPTLAVDHTIVQGVPQEGFGTEGGVAGSTFWAGTETTGGQIMGRYKTWIPFVVNLANATTIVSATFTIINTISNPYWGAAGVRVGCDLRCDIESLTPPPYGGSIEPTTYDELNMIVTTPSFVNGTITDGVGVATSFDITNAVQEVINNVNWANTPDPYILGVIVSGNTDNTGAGLISAFSNGTAYVPTLVITTT
jgi:hypothetical protein